VAKEEKPKYWVLTVRLEGFLRMFKEGEVLCTKSAVNLIKPNDIVIVYIKGMKIFAGAFRILTKWEMVVRDVFMVIDELKGKVLYRARVETIAVGKVEVERLIDKLSFIRKKSVWYSYFLGNVANFRRPIPEEDARLIIEELKAHELAI